jgi:hypothetical protein
MRQPALWSLTVDPFREKRLSPADVRRALVRASEIADSLPETPAVEKSLTRGELEQAGTALGLPARAIAEALDDDEPAPGEERPRRRGFLGAPTRFVLEKELPGEPSDDEREDLLDEIRTVVGDTGSIETVGKSLIWKHSGNTRQLSVRLRSRDGRSRIVVEERLTRQATGLFVGIGVGGGIGPLGGYVLAILKLGVLGLLFPLIWIPCLLLLARTIFAALARRRERELRKLMTRLTRAAAGWSGARQRSRTRVAAATGEGDAEQEAEAAEEPELEARAPGVTSSR